MAFTEIYGDVYTAAGSGIKFPLQGGADMVEVVNQTKTLDVSTSGTIRGYWRGPKFGAAQTAAGGGERWYRAATAAIGIGQFSDAGGTPTATAGTGFTYVPTVPFIEAQAAAAITNISQADGAIVLQTNTYSNNDILVLYNTTGMLQIAGMTFEISSVSGSQYTMLGLNSSAFAAPGTAGNTRRVSNKEAVEPQYLYITEITRASQAVVRTSVNPGRYYVAGMMVYFSVPSSFGMTQINGLMAKIISIDEATYKMTVDLDTSSFSAFAFPASSGSPTTRLFATLASSGQRTQQNQLTGVYTGYDFNLAPFHTGQFTPYLWIPTGQWSAGGTVDDNLIISAYKYEN
jgi:hypothetical protein